MRSLFIGHLWCRASVRYAEGVANTMREDEFEVRLIEVLDMPSEGAPYPPYADPYPADPRDARFDSLCALYLEADEAQRAQVSAAFAPEESTRAYARIADWMGSRERARNDLSNLIFYMRRVASAIRSGEDTPRLRLGLAAAAILQEREDYRDIIVSLAFLHHAARRVGIDPDPIFREVAGLARPETEEFIRGFLKRDEADIEQMVEAFS
jgi:hypothetical protein